MPTLTDSDEHSPKPNLVFLYPSLLSLPRSIPLTHPDPFLGILKEKSGGKESSNNEVLWGGLLVYN